MLTQEQVAEQMDWSISKVIRIEAGSTGISTNDLKALLRLYGHHDDPDLTDELVMLARAARERSWSNPYRDLVSPGLLQLIEYEAASLIIRNFETLLVPGLLQTEDYARAVIQQFEKRATVERVNTLVKFRMMRQEQLDRHDPPLLSFVLDEAVVRRLIGGRDIMYRQILRLLEMAAKPNVTIEIVPFIAGIHPGLRGSFVVVEFSDPGDDDVLFLETPLGGLVNRNDPEEVLTCREQFEQLRQLSLGPSNSLTYLDKIAHEIIGPLP